MDGKFHYIGSCSRRHKANRFSFFFSNWFTNVSPFFFTVLLHQTTVSEEMPSAGDITDQWNWWVKYMREKKGEIWLSPMTKALHPQKHPKSNATTQNHNQKLRLHNDCGPNRTVNGSNNSHPTCVVKPGLRTPNLPAHRKCSVTNCTNTNRGIWILVKNWYVLAVEKETVGKGLSTKDKYYTSHWDGKEEKVNNYYTFSLIKTMVKLPSRNNAHVALWARCNPSYLQVPQ